MLFDVYCNYFTVLLESDKTILPKDDPLAGSRNLYRMNICKINIRELHPLSLSPKTRGSLFVIAFFLSS